MWLTAVVIIFCVHFLFHRICGKTPGGLNANSKQYHAKACFAAYKLFNITTLSHKLLYQIKFTVTYLTVCHTQLYDIK